MTFTRSRLVGAAFIVLGLAVLCLGASAQMGFFSDATEHTAAPSAAPAPRDERAPPADLRVQASLGALSVDRSVALPVAAPVPVKLDRDAGAANVPVPVAARVGLDNAIAPDAAAPHPQAQSVQTLSQRAVLSSPQQAAIVGAAVVTGAGLVVYFWAGVKSWAARALVLPIVTLYAKVSRAEVFDNAVREGIFGAIRAHPGRSASDLAKLAGVSWGTTIYHLEVLEHNRMVTSLRQGRHRRYFENGAVLPASKETVSILQNAVTALVVERVRAQPGLTQKDLAAALAMSPQALHWHLARLQAVGVVQKQREGRVVRHFASATTN